jgi:DNA polymerase-1
MIWKHKPKLLILDGRHLLWRSSDAFSTLSVEINGEDVGTGGIYGFLSIALRINRKYGGKTVVAWEGKDNFRYRLYPEYKKRPEPDEEKILLLKDMRQQEQRIKAILRAMGVRQYSGVGCEADDVIGTLAKSWTKGGTKQAIIYSGDSDLRQCVTGYTTVIAPVKGKDVEYDSEAVVNRYLFSPVYISDIKALAGDSSDNIPGAKGVGEKYATELIKKYGDCKAIIRAAKKNKKDWPIPERFKKEILLFKKLTRVRTNAGMKEIKVKKDQARVVGYLKLYKMFSLIAPPELRGLMKMGKKK